MEVLIQYEYRPSKKEPFGILLRRLHDGLVQASLPVRTNWVSPIRLLGIDPLTAGSVMIGTL